MELRPGYKQIEIGVIPEDWSVSALRDLFAIKSGFAFSSEYYDDKGPVLLTPGNFRLTGGLSISKRNTVRYSGPYPVSSIFSRGDLLIVMTDLTPDCKLLGKPAFVDSEEPILHNQRIGKIVLTSKRVSSDFLYWYFLSEAHASRMKGTATGSTVRHTSNQSIYDSQISYPSDSSEQRAIATALSDVDALLAKIDQLIAKKRDLKQAAMQQLLTGQTRLPGFSGEWEVKRLGDVVEIRKGQLITEKTAVFGDIPVIAGGKKPAYFHNQPNRVGKTITVSASGASAGYVALFDHPIFASDCSTISEGKDYSIEFICYQMQLRQDAIYRAQTGGAQPHIHAVDLAPIEVGCPGLAEQTAIATVLSDMDAELAALEARRDKTRALKQGMMQALLTGRIRLVGAN
jgi:type I restriction enzyme S subunit